MQSFDGGSNVSAHTYHGAVRDRPNHRPEVAGVAESEASANAYHAELPRVPLHCGEAWPAQPALQSWGLGSRDHGHAMAARMGRSAASPQPSSRPERRDDDSVVSSVTGKATVQLRVYPDCIPSLMVMYHVSTMDAQNHIMWARQYDAQTRAGLRKLIHNGLSRMVADTLYPTGGVATALTAPAQDTVWSLLSSLPPPNQAALTMEE